MSFERGSFSVLLCDKYMGHDNKTKPRFVSHLGYPSHFGTTLLCPEGGGEAHSTFQSRDSNRFWPKAQNYTKKYKRIINYTTTDTQPSTPPRCMSKQGRCLVVASLAAACCSVLQCAAVSCSELEWVAVCCLVVAGLAAACCGYVDADGDVLQCVAVCCSVLQCVAVCCSVLQWVAVGCMCRRR